MSLWESSFMELLSSTAHSREVMWRRMSGKASRSSWARWDLSSSTTSEIRSATTSGPLSGSSKGFSSAARVIQSLLE
jgi:hypothetical protein